MDKWSQFGIVLAATTAVAAGTTFFVLRSRDDEGSIFEDPRPPARSPLRFNTRQIMKRMKRTAAPKRAMLRAPSAPLLRHLAARRMPVPPPDGLLKLAMLSIMAAGPLSAPTRGPLKLGQTWSSFNGGKINEAEFQRRMIQAIWSALAMGYDVAPGGVAYGAATPKRLSLLASTWDAAAVGPDPRYVLARLVQRAEQLVGTPNSIDWKKSWYCHPIPTRIGETAKLLASHSSGIGSGGPCSRKMSKEIKLLTYATVRAGNIRALVPSDPMGMAPQEASSRIGPMVAFVMQMADEKSPVWPVAPPASPSFDVFGTMLGLFKVFGFALGGDIKSMIDEGQQICRDSAIDNGTDPDNCDF